MPAAEYTFDPKARALYVYLAPKVDAVTASTSGDVPAMVNVDLDANGNVVGIEIINPWPESAGLPESMREACDGRHVGEEDGR